MDKPKFPKDRKDKRYRNNDPILIFILGMATGAVIIGLLI